MGKNISNILGICALGFIVNQAAAIQLGSGTGSGVTDQTTLTADADVRPSINVRSKGMITVSLLTINGFNAQDVNVGSVRFGPGGAEEAHHKGHYEDVDNDGDVDLVMHFKTQDTGITCATTTVSLTGTMLNGQSFSTTNSIMPKGC